MDESQKPEPSSPVPLEYRGRPAGDAGPPSRIKLRLTLSEAIFAAAVVLVIVAFFVLPSMRTRVSPTRLKCASNLKNIAAACITYSNTHNGNYPASFEEMLLSSGMPSQVFICPESNDSCIEGTHEQQAASLSTGGHLSYIYLGKGLTSDSPPDTVLVYEPLSNHRNAGMNVLFNDYRVQWLAPAEGQKLINSIVPGNPTVWPPVKKP